MLSIRNIALTFFITFSSLGHAEERISPEHQILYDRFLSASHCFMILALEGAHSVELEFEVDATFYSEEATERRMGKMMNLALFEFDLYAEQFFKNARRSQYVLRKWRDPSNMMDTWAGKQLMRLTMDGLNEKFDEIDTRIRKCVDVYELDIPEDDLPFDYDNAEILKPPF